MLALILLIVLGVLPGPAHGLQSMQNQSPIVGPLLTASVTGIATFIRFALPLKTKDPWRNYNHELQQELYPIQGALANDIISPTLAGDQILATTQEFLLSKPDFVESEKPGQYTKNKPAILEKAKSVKNSLRKELRKTNDSDTRKQLQTAIRSHNRLKKEYGKREKHKTAIYQEKLFKNDFWKFSKSVVNGTFGTPSVCPAFDKTVTDQYYNNKYNVGLPLEPLNLDNLKWFPYIAPRDDPSRNYMPFSMEPIKPKDVKSVLKTRNNSSALGPDGVTYGILKQLPAIHHTLAILYSKILMSGSPPPTSWTNSSITLIYKKGDNSQPRTFE